MATSHTPSPAYSKRGRVAALSRSRTADDPEYVAARQDLASFSIEQHVRRVLASAPPLTAEQADRIVGIIRPSIAS